MDIVFVTGVDGRELSLAFKAQRRAHREVIY